MSIGVVLALGSNLGDSEAILRLASEELSLFSKTDLIASSIWRSRPEGFAKDVPEFFNAVVYITVEISPETLLDEVLLLERKLGRLREKKIHQYSSRSIDIDIIDYGGLVYSSNRLVLPHPRAHTRQFVLRPLIEIKPGFCFPNISDSLNQLFVLAKPNKMEFVSQLIPSA
ncbi:MAG: 2-amino-4-hydroxy-6-hydroxymethyldihydropteridine diphosphokinase [Pseudomonadota bacterium]|nr:2-amino-4-hydroxy-6-hydroxymethyldihydropteridine diphosphokinase [Pseudomonadota bacterium]